MIRSGCSVDVPRKKYIGEKNLYAGGKVGWSSSRFAQKFTSLINKFGSRFGFRNLFDILMYSTVGLVAILCYLNSLTGDFVHDDIVAITRNPDVLGHTSIWRLFFNDFWGKPMADPLSHKSYRPLTVLTFRWNMSLGGFAVEGYHLVNVTLHALVVCLLTYTCRIVLRWNIENSTVVGLLFAVHPVHTEAVANIVGRAELLSAFFFFVSFVSFHRWRSARHESKRILSVLTFGSAFFALLAKEQGITVVAVNLGYHLATLTKQKLEIRYMKERNRLKQVWLDRYTFSLFFGLVALLGFRTLMLHGSLPTFSVQDNPAAFSPSVLTRFLTKTYLVTFNAWLMLCPSNLSYDWQMGSIPLVETIWHRGNLGSVFLFSGMGAIFMCNRKTGKVQEKIVLSVALVILIVPFLPASNLLVTVGFVVAERILYIPRPYSQLVLEGFWQANLISILATGLEPARNLEHFCSFDTSYPFWSPRTRLPGAEHVRLDVNIPHEL
ncbi:protein O-mannosyl-transferase TMTC1-like [Tachypleus tridentatus]|uniref:protein O-mannosyl-transferase TMTC1-like n=1 Tax=Tachypleus tridentatus TaxID=6853 RepID=UPI003FD35360